MLSHRIFEWLSPDRIFNLELPQIFKKWRHFSIDNLRPSPCMVKERMFSKRRGQLCSTRIFLARSPVFAHGCCLLHCHGPHSTPLKSFLWPFLTPFTALEEHHMLWSWAFRKPSHFHSHTISWVLCHTHPLAHHRAVHGFGCKKYQKANKEENLGFFFCLFGCSFSTNHRVSASSFQKKQLKKRKMSRGHVALPH